MVLMLEADVQAAASVARYNLLLFGQCLFFHPALVLLPSFVLTL